MEFMFCLIFQSAISCLPIIIDFCSNYTYINDNYIIKLEIATAYIYIYIYIYIFSIASESLKQIACLPADHLELS